MEATTITQARGAIAGLFAGLWRPVPAPPTVGPLPTLAKENVATVAAKARKRSQPRAASVLEILDILREVRRPLTVSELAVCMDCCVGEASKRVAAAGKLLRKRRRGRCVYVSVAQISLPEWKQAHALLRGESVRQ